jgi:DNA-binding transcriptional MerR regulator
MSRRESHSDARDSLTGDAATEATFISIKKAAEQANVDVYVVRHCVEVGLMERQLNEDDLAELRRVRRLMTLGINLPGVEVVLRMRRRIQELQAEMIRLERRLRS